ncbi:MAG: gliding motility-associated C-terminal domain-containing protein, partial [Bacteroidales bacterium]|nr:gliding motility-associated C-terminal domain-containing protein [Bacteroidales bacterium]
SLKEAVIDTVLHGVCEISATDLKVNTPFALDACTNDTIWGVGTRRSGKSMDDPYIVGRDTIDWKFVSEYSTETAYCEQYVFIQSDTKPVFDCDSLKEAVIDTVLNGVCEISADDLKINTPFALDACTNDTIWGVGTRRSGEAMNAAYKVGRDTIDWKFVSEFSSDIAYCEQYIFIQSNLQPIIDCDSLKKVLIDTVLHGTCEIAAIDLEFSTPFALDACTNDTIWGVGTRRSGKSMDDPYGVGNDTIDWKFVSEFSTETVYCEQYVFIQGNTEPDFDCKASLHDTVIYLGLDQCELPAGYLTLPIPTAKDACTNSDIPGVPLRGDGKAMEDAYPKDTTAITWTFTSEYSVISKTCYHYQNVIVLDTFPPMPDCSNMDSIKIQITDSSTYFDSATYQEVVDAGLRIPVYKDACDGDITAIGIRDDSLPLESTYPLGATTINWTYIDKSGNTAICTQIIFIDKWIIDTLYCPGDLDGKVYSCVDDIPAPYQTFADFKDAGGSFANENKIKEGSFLATDSLANDSCDLIVTRTYQITDLHDNIITCEEVIYVKDTVAPQFIDILRDTVLSCEDEIFDALEVRVSDNCDPSPRLTYTETTNRGDNPNSCDYYNYDIVRTYTVTDRCGNSTSQRQMILIRDTVGPKFEFPDNWDDYVLADFQKKCTFKVPDFSEEVRAFIHDNCSENENITIVQVPKAGSLIKQSIDVKIYVYDMCENADSTIKHVKVQDGASIAHLTAYDIDSCVTDDQGISLASQDIRYATGEMEIIDTWDGQRVKISSTFVYEYYRGKEAKEENLIFSNNPITYWHLYEGLVPIYGSVDHVAEALTKLHQKSESGYYTMVAMDTTSGCSDTATIHVNVIERPKMILDSHELSVCEGNLIDLSPYVKCIDNMGADSVWTYWKKNGVRFDYEDSINGIITFDDNDATLLFYAENRCGATSSFDSHLAFCKGYNMTTEDSLASLDNDTAALELLRANLLFSRDSILLDVHQRYNPDEIIIKTDPTNPPRIWRGESITLSVNTDYEYKELIWYKVIGQYDRRNFDSHIEHEEFIFDDPDDDEDEEIAYLLSGESSTIVEYPQDTTYYYVTISDGVCPSVASALTKVLVLPEIPTAFTPHTKDGLNDVFMERHYVKIFDRYGQKVFEGNNGWDGSFHGRVADPGVYYHKVRMGDGSYRTGTIEIIKLK